MSKIILTSGAAAPTPTTGTIALYSKTDKKMYVKDDTGLEAGLNTLSTAADIRGLGFFDVTNDGTGSGLDADLLDGNEATAFATAAQGTLADSALQNIIEDITPQLGGNLDVNDKIIINSGTGDVVVTDTLVALNDNLTSFRLRGPNSVAVTVQSYGGIFYNAAFAGTSSSGLDTRAIFGANIEMDLEIQGPRQVRITAVDDTQSDGQIRIASKTDIVFNARTDAEINSPNRIIFDRETTGTTGIANTSAATIETDSGNMVLWPGRQDNDLVAIVYVKTDLSMGSNNINDVANPVLAQDAATKDYVDNNHGLDNVVEDTTPQLGGQLDVNGNGLGDGTNLLLDFVEDASAVNNIQIENEATGSGPIIRSVGTDTDIDLVLDTKGTGVVALLSPLGLGGTPLLALDTVIDPGFTIPAIAAGPPSFVDVPLGVAAPTAVPGDSAILGFLSSPPPGLTFDVFVAAPTTVIVRVSDVTGGGFAGGPLGLKVTIMSF